MQEVIKEEIIEENKKETMRFKVQAAIAFPDAAQALFTEEQQEVPDFEQYDPENPGFSDEGVEFMMKSLEQFGFYIEEEDE